MPSVDETRGLWRAPHLPLFILTALAALLVPLGWVIAPGWQPADPLLWHWHELLLGMGGAAAGGYLLSALPSWTPWRCPPVVTGLLVLAWLAARLGYALGGGFAALALAYPLGLTLTLALPLLAARRWSRLAFAAVPAGLLGAEAMLLARPGTDPLILVLGFAALLSLIGGRIVPAFLAARLQAAPLATPPPARWRRGPAPIIASLAPLALALLGAPAGWIGASALLLVLLSLDHMRRWPRPRLGGNGDVMMLLPGWLCLLLGLSLCGADLLLGHEARLAGDLHVLTMGSMGGMIYAVAARAYMRRAPGRLVPQGNTVLGLACLLLAALLRLQAARYGLWPVAGLWGLGWAIFLRRALVAAFHPLPRPVLSARRA